MEESSSKAVVPDTSVSATASPTKSVVSSDDVDVVNDSPTKNSSIVLPASTSSGERVSDDDRETEGEVVYSSVPPDLNKDSIARATPTSDTGTTFIVKKIRGKLNITLMDTTTVLALPFTSVRDPNCIVCNREVPTNEMYLNFPDDLDRRRLWGNMLGFRYCEMLRLRMGPAANVPSTGIICTDHFSEECFRKFNFNKAAIEAFGIPLAISPHVNVTPSKKRTPWDCSVCKFRSHSVHTLHMHLIEHTKEAQISTEVRKLLNGKGLSCPFCRNCTYYYKTLSGFGRHLQLEPVTHFYLKRIHEVAKKNFRSASLEPASEWASWSERNVYYAYHGCEPPPLTPQKRPLSSQGASPTKRMLASPAVIREIENEELAKSESIGKESVKRTLLFTPMLPTPSETPKKVTPKKEVESGSSTKNTPEEIKKLFLRLPVRSKPAARRVIITSNEQRTTIADVLNEVSVHDKDEPGLDVITETVLSDPLPLSCTFLDDRFMRSMRRKTQRQLESNEARLRLFGDSTYVDVPDGYKKIDTAHGPRIISMKARAWEEGLGSVKVLNRRLLPINRE
ncbi:unnamed protein product [Auanema sp. JU1783]|nr:unnamed protein product [Auanema sp. JU1783]